MTDSVKLSQSAETGAWPQRRKSNDLSLFNLRRRKGGWKKKENDDDMEMKDALHHKSQQQPLHKHTYSRCWHYQEPKHIDDEEG